MSGKEGRHEGGQAQCGLTRTLAHTPARREKKLLALIQKQDRLLYLCFYMLLNLAEDVGVEKKMKKKVRCPAAPALGGLCATRLTHLASPELPRPATSRAQNIVVYLVKMLDRSNVELLILATTFLKKLSIYQENKVRRAHLSWPALRKPWAPRPHCLLRRARCTTTTVVAGAQEKMGECKIVDKLAKFVPVRNDVLLMSVLRLLHNLSFDGTLRDAMVKNGFIPKVRTSWRPFSSTSTSSAPCLCVLLAPRIRTAR